MDCRAGPDAPAECILDRAQGGSRACRFPHQTGTRFPGIFGRLVVLRAPTPQMGPFLADDLTGRLFARLLSFLLPVRTLWSLTLPFVEPSTRPQSAEPETAGASEPRSQPSFTQ
jgi:hypothetical protein